MDTNVKKTPHAVYVINYHLVWIPRYRKKVPVGRIAERLKELLSEIARVGAKRQSPQYGFRIVAIEVMPDHVHLFVSAPPKYSPAEIVHLFGDCGFAATLGISSRRLMGELVRTEFAYLRRQYWGERATLWAESYYVGMAGHVSAVSVLTPTIQRYIENQKG